ncbi:MAG: hypothetical protein KY475_22585, partial [Planctomycetes bacterium]|nr:hypothetical protein [Planctomycetota bacterium]
MTSLDPHTPAARIAAARARRPGGSRSDPASAGSFPRTGGLARLWLLIVLLSSPGCALFGGYSETFDDFAVGWRNRMLAREAWQQRRDQFAPHPHLHDFGKGFRAGYIEAASGGTGCLPPLPPREYWSWRYNSKEGQGQIQAWFEGYPHGVQAAEEDGVAYFGLIPTSHAIDVQLQHHHPHDYLLRSPYVTPPPEAVLSLPAPLEVLPPALATPPQGPPPAEDETLPPPFERQRPPPSDETPGPLVPPDDPG